MKPLKTHISSKTITARKEGALPIKRKPMKRKEKMYSYDEYKKTFRIKHEKDMDTLPASPRVFGVKLAQEALRKIKKDSGRQ